MDAAFELQWGHGDEAVEETNAPTAGDLTATMLQWGHGDEAVEEHSSADRVVLGDKASMGPRR